MCHSFFAQLSLRDLQHAVSAVACSSVTIVTICLLSEFYDSTHFFSPRVWTPHWVQCCGCCGSAVAAVVFSCSETAEEYRRRCCNSLVPAQEEKRGRITQEVDRCNLYLKKPVSVSYSLVLLWLLIVKASQNVTRNLNGYGFRMWNGRFSPQFPEQSMTKIKTFDWDYHNYPDNILSPVISSSLTNIRVRGPQVSLTMGPGGQNILRLHKKNICHCSKLFRTTCCKKHWREEVGASQL